MRNPVNIKKSILIILSAVLIFSLCGCFAPTEDEAKTEKKYITVGKVAPLTGSLNRYGEGSLEAEEYAIKKINDEGGIFIDESGKKMPVRFVIADSGSTKKGAASAAQKLIEEDNVDVMIASDTAKTVNPVAAVCEQKGVPLISVNAENDDWYENGPYEYCFNASFDNKSMFDGASALLEKAGISVIGIMAPENDYGRKAANAFSEYCTDNKITLVDPGRYTEGITDYSAVIKLFTAGKTDGLICFMDNVDFETFWKQTKESKLSIKQVSIFNDSFLGSEIPTLGKSEGFASGICSKTNWRRDFPYVSSLTGETSQDIAGWWERTFTSDCPELLGYKYANIEILVDILKRSTSLNPEKIAKAAMDTDMNTVIGNISFNDRHQAILPLAMCQWNYNISNTGTGKWTEDIVDNSACPEIVLTGELSDIINITR